MPATLQPPTGRNRSQPPNPPVATRIAPCESPGNGPQAHQVAPTRTGPGAKAQWNQNTNDSPTTRLTYGYPPRIGCLKRLRGW